ncbi:MAG TPA: hypothetical protein VGF67_00750 [Ktedonobacteraceae bacterium]
MIGSAAVMLLIGILFGVFFAGPLLVSAHGTTPSAAAANPAVTNPSCQQFLQDLARRLNVPLATLEQDRKAAKEDVLAQLVKDGKLTQAQADAIKQRLESRQACSGHGRVPGDKGILRQTFTKYAPTLLNTLASALHLSSTQLSSDLQSGQTLSQIASAEHIASSQLPTILLNAVQHTLDQARQAGDITQSQETAFLQVLHNHPHLIDRLLHHAFAKK